MTRPERITPQAIVLGIIHELESRLARELSFQITCIRTQHETAVRKKPREKRQVPVRGDVPEIGGGNLKTCGGGSRHGGGKKARFPAIVQRK